MVLVQNTLISTNALCIKLLRKVGLEKLLHPPSFSLSLSNLFFSPWNSPCKNNKIEQNSHLIISNSNFTMKGCTDKDAILDFVFAY